VRRLLLTATTTALLLLAGAQSAYAHFYTVKVSPATATAGSRTVFSVKISNQFGPAPAVNSVDITVPAGFTLISASVPSPGTATKAGSTVRLRNLGLGNGRSTTATVVADVPCATGAKTWGASSPDRGLDSANSARTTTLTGSCTACPENTDCSVTASRGDTAATVTAFGDPARPDTGVLTLTFTVGPRIDCAGYTELTPDTALFDFRGGDRAKTATLTVDKEAVNATSNNGAASLEMCFGASRSFTTKSGAPAAVQGSFDWNADGVAEPVFVGLLPNCGKDSPGPCIEKRKKVGAGDGYIRARVPLGLGDPAMRP